MRGALDSLPLLPLNSKQENTTSVLKATGTDDLRLPKFAPGFAPTTDKPSESQSFPVKMAGMQESDESEGKLAVSPDPVKTKHPPTTGVSGCQKSGQEDLNLRPHGPEPCALAKLSYAPFFRLE